MYHEGEAKLTQSFAPLTPENLRGAHGRVKSRTMIGKLALRGIELDEKRSEL